MTTKNTWQQHIESLLTKNGQFKLIDTTRINQTTTEHYKQQVSDEDTVIKISYLDNGRLITLDITNPKTPGHNTEQLDYFFENDFDQSKRSGRMKPGLLFNEVNLDAISNIIKSGLRGTEVKYYINDKLQFSKVNKPIGNSDELYSMTHYFADKNFWIRFLKKIFQPNTNYIIEEIDLRKIFGGIK